MFSVSKKLFLVCLFTVFSITAARFTRKLDLIVNIDDPAYFFVLNTGSELIPYPTVPRPQGSSFVTNAYIFPGGTVSKSQSSYLVDKNGDPLDFSESLGMAYVFDKLVVDLDFEDLPPVGTLTDISEWQFVFKTDCHDKANILCAFGSGRSGILGAGEVLQYFVLPVVKGTGCNARDNSCTGKVYAALDGSALIKITFDQDISYND